MIVYHMKILGGGKMIVYHMKILGGGKNDCLSHENTWCLSHENTWWR